MAAVIQASRKKCLLLSLTVLRGENVTLGYWNDLVDTPDPYVKLRLPLSPNGKRKTKSIGNNANPTWNETFEFMMDPKLDNTMSVTLMEADIVSDDTVQTVHYNFKDLDLEIDGQPKTLDVVFNKVCHVFLKLQLSTYKSEIPKGVRFNTILCGDEISFQQKRKQFVFDAMRAVLGERGPKNINEVPTVAILGSGGGFRAMTGLSGATCALKDLGIFDCSTYMAGLSGSAWYLSTLYSNPNWPKIHPVEVNNEIRDNVSKNWVWLLFTPSWLRKRISAILEKKRRGQPVSFTDLFGYLVGDTLLVNRENPLLSDQQNTIKDGKVPMPLYACTHVEKAISAEIFNEWMELTPYEVGMFKYGTFLTPEVFGNKYFCGVCIEEYPELPLHFVQGFCGSAFTVMLQRLIDDPSDPETTMKKMKKIPDDGASITKDDVKSGVEHEDSDNESDGEDNTPEETNDDKEVDDTSTLEKIGKFFISKIEFLKTREGRAAKVHNFLRGLELIADSKGQDKVDNRNFANNNEDARQAILKQTTDSTYKRMFVCDAGLVFNSPYPLILREGRHADLILSFDYSAREKDVSPPFEELIKAEQWARLHNYRFPPINHKEQYDKHGLREYYVFKDDNDPRCPVVIHFPLVNNLFRTYKAPGVPRVNLKEVEAGKLSLFEDPDNPYSTFNFHYPNEPFDRLVELTNFNAKVCNDVICNTMAECVARKRHCTK